MFNRILVLCTGNICRSPIAEALLKDRLPGQPDISSAGIGAMIGHPAHEHARAVCTEHDLDIEAHVARQVSEADLHAADLVLVMDEGHKRWLQGRYPVSRGRTYLIGHWRKQEVVDPMGKPKEAFDASYATLDDCVNDWLTRL